MHLRGLQASQVFAFMFKWNSFAYQFLLINFRSGLKESKDPRHEIAYQTCTEGGLTKELKAKKKAIWPQFPVACGGFSLFDVGHAFGEVENVTCLQLFKFPARPFDLNNVAQEFTTNVKIRVFSGKKDLFDDLFQSKSSLKEILQEISRGCLQVTSRNSRYTEKEG